MLNNLSYLLMFFGGFMSWTIALMILLENDKKIFQYMYFGYIFCLGALQIYVGLLVTTGFRDYTYLIFWHLPFLSWIGPFLILSFKTANADSFHIRPVDYLHFVFGILMVLLMMPLALMDAETKMSFIMNKPDLTTGNVMFRYYSILSVAVGISVFIYFLYFIRNFYFLLDYKKGKKVSEYLIIVGLIMFSLTVVFLLSMLVSILFEYEKLNYIGILQLLTSFSFFLILIICILEKKKINFFVFLNAKLKERRYEISKVNTINVALVLSMMKTLMVDEKKYIDDELSLNSMAGELGISPFQLSQIINENFNKNFNSFINEYRIEEARMLLLADTKRTITSIAYAVGFNSTTVFYEWFKRTTGVSPKIYRSKNNHKSEPVKN